MLVDTGSDVCCFPRRLLPGRRWVPTRYTLSAANESSIKTYGLYKMSLNLGLRRSFTWNFIVADVSTPIVGSDFLAHYHLLPDCKLKRLVDGTTGLHTDGTTRTIKQPSVKAIGTHVSHTELLAEFPDITRPAGTPREVKHSTVHYIKTSPGQPVSCKPRRLNAERLAVAQNEFNAMLQDGTARPSDSSRCTSSRRRAALAGGPAAITGP